MEKSYYEQQLEEIKSKQKFAFRKAYQSYWTPEPQFNCGEVDSNENSHDREKRETIIPDWFHVFETFNVIHLWSNTPPSRYTELLNIIADLERDCSNAQRVQQQPQKFDKEWHEPSKSWSTPARQQSGG
ncbi:hypothetical protein BGZ63DRAFT_381024 [Mariannaea sp. PMI_226]|nr:hypothetical protein BGZ63DRAFT_398182 [Mariannaea sp. PMI_226]KAI5463289.1 hypothetical protein BGZ63DRAFT_381024 [Mariannaea sp. PMI_226]